MNDSRNSVQSSSPCADAVTAIDAFLRVLRCHRSPSQLVATIDQYLALQTVLDAAARSLTSNQLPPEPLRSNYRARLQTLAFELRRAQPILAQERSRVSQTLRNSTACRAWLETLASTQ
jgi:hypothetical protein